MIPKDAYPLAFAILSFLLCAPLSAQHESTYISALAKHLDAKREVPVTSGRVDLVTATHAIEVERAEKWKNSIGQALWYGLQTNRRPGIILIITEPANRKYAIQLGSALDYAGLSDKIQVWLYPDDFPTVEAQLSSLNKKPVGEQLYWLNTSSGKRHTQFCSHFKATSRGRLCTVAEGEPAGSCH